jgi:rubredoxin
MDKYECIACGYIYDPEIGDPKIGFAPIAVLARINSKRSANINYSTSKTT